MQQKLHFLLLLASLNFFAQEKDTILIRRFSFHGQTTVINQTKSGFSVPYTGNKSLLPNNESQTSLTATCYLGARLWNGASVYLNPEIAGGSGLSAATGIAAATNGETFRIGDPAPKLYLARLFVKQRFKLSDATYYQWDEANKVAEMIPVKYISVTVGKISIADFFDFNTYSHDPRTHFMSWALMSNGAWDYPANTRGYTPSVVLEYISTKNEWRYGISLVPLWANGNEMNWDVKNANANTLEYTRKYSFKKHPGAIRILAFYNTTNMGNYQQSLQTIGIPNIESTRRYGRSKYGFGINAEQEFLEDLGVFARASWNDGKNETWAFTEIDHSFSFGACLKGNRWKRKGDSFNVAYVASGISNEHQAYLKAGGQGFILGDGNLNYAMEQLVETFYSMEMVKKSMVLSGAYQFVINPGYNADRQGPIHVFSLRMHYTF